MPGITKETINQEIINAIGSCYDLLCQGLYNSQGEWYYAHGRAFLKVDIERELWIHFVNRRLAEFEDDGRFHLVFDELLTRSGLPWNRILDLIEFVCKWISVNIADHPYLANHLKKFESNINNEFDRLNYGYRIVNHCIVDITSDVEMDTINEALSSSKDNVREHLQRAIGHYSARPNPDVRNSIKESISAVEAVCRELTGDDTLGKALKHLEERGVVIHKTLKDQFTKFYVYTSYKKLNVYANLQQLL